jgi:hypothetical protein
MHNRVTCTKGLFSASIASVNNSHINGVPENASHPPGFSTVKKHGDSSSKKPPLGGKSGGQHQIGDHNVEAFDLPCSPFFADEDNFKDTFRPDEEVDKARRLF